MPCRFPPSGKPENAEWERHNPRSRGNQARLRKTGCNHSTARLLLTLSTRTAQAATAIIVAIATIPTLRTPAVAFSEDLVGRGIAVLRAALIVMSTFGIHRFTTRCQSGARTTQTECTSQSTGKDSFESLPTRCTGSQNSC